MHAVELFIQDLAVIMLIAGVVTVVFNRFKQPVVLGYIVAGVIIGPHTPPFNLIQDDKTVHILSELGVIFLLFSLGLEFSLKKLAKVGATAVVAAVAEIMLMIWIGYEIGIYFGWKTMDAVFLGAMLAVSSTTIIVKALNELGMKNEKFAQIIFGILIVEDILAIGMIALLSGIATSGSVDSGEVVNTVGKLLLFMVVSLVVGILIVPRLLNYVARFKSNEMLLVTVLGILFGFCLLVMKLEYSVALGAFLVGAVMAESRQIHRIERIIESIRDMFSAIFFVAIGLLFDPNVLAKYWLPITVITFRGTQDDLAIYGGGLSNLVRPIHFLGAINSMKKWAELDGCTGQAKDLGNNCQGFAAAQCPSGVESIVCTKTGGGHEQGNGTLGWPVLKRHQLP